MAQPIGPLLEQMHGAWCAAGQGPAGATGGHLSAGRCSSAHCEDLPGVGKTTLAEALARSFGLAFQRVLFTSDLLPADLAGLRLFDESTGAFRLEPGPVSAQVLLADEINQASPRTFDESTLLESIASGRVSADGISHGLCPRPFFVIATQRRPRSGQDLAPLPESQLDQFEMHLSLGSPPRLASGAGPPQRPAARSITCRP